MKYTEKLKDGSEVVRWDTSKKYTKEELKKQREEFLKTAKAGKLLCLTDLFANHGM